MKTRDQLEHLGAHLTPEELGELLDGFFHARHRTEELHFSLEARRRDTSSLLECLDFDGQLNSFAFSL
jgi:hypothetical protein